VPEGVVFWATATSADCPAGVGEVHSEDTDVRSFTKAIRISHTVRKKNTSQEDVILTLSINTNGDVPPDVFTHSIQTHLPTGSDSRRSKLMYQYERNNMRFKAYGAYKS